MHLITAFEATTRAVARAARRRLAGPGTFACSQCDRNAQCGLPPQDDCVYRLMLIEERGRYPARPVRSPLAPRGLQ